MGTYCTVKKIDEVLHDTLYKIFPETKRSKKLKMLKTDVDDGVIIKVMEIALKDFIETIDDEPTRLYLKYKMEEFIDGQGSSV